MNKTVVRAALPSNYSLLDPNNYPSILPNGFEEGFHPVLVANALGNDISMQSLGVGLEIPYLIEGLVYITFVDRLGDGKTPFQYPMFQIIGGANGQVLAPLVPGEHVVIEILSTTDFRSACWNFRRLGTVSRHFPTRCQCLRSC